MKSEQEIRSYRDNLRYVARIVDRSAHGMNLVDLHDCLAITVASVVLSWVLGENEHHERLVEDVAAFKARG